MRRPRKPARLSLLWMAAMAVAWACAGLNGAPIDKPAVPRGQPAGLPSIDATYRRDLPQGQTSAVHALIESRLQRVIAAELPADARFTLVQISRFGLQPERVEVQGWGLLETTDSPTSMLQLELTLERHSLQPIDLQARQLDAQGRLLQQLSAPAEVVGDSRRSSG